MGHSFLSVIPGTGSNIITLCRRSVKVEKKRTNYSEQKPTKTHNCRTPHTIVGLAKELESVKETKRVKPRVIICNRRKMVVYQ